jgi:hypothetical protein
LADRDLLASRQTGAADGGPSSLQPSGPGRSMKTKSRDTANRSGNGPGNEIGRDHPKVHYTGHREQRRGSNPGGLSQDRRYHGPPRKPINTRQRVKTGRQPLLAVSQESKMRRKARPIQQKTGTLVAPGSLPWPSRPASRLFVAQRRRQKGNAGASLAWSSSDVVARLPCIIHIHPGSHQHRSVATTHHTDRCLASAHGVNDILGQKSAMVRRRNQAISDQDRRQFIENFHSPGFNV